MVDEFGNPIGNPGYGLGIDFNKYTAPKVPVANPNAIPGIKAGVPTGMTGLDIANVGAKGVQALTGLYGAYLGHKGLGLAKEQFGFEKGLANRNLANQANLINQERENAAKVGLALGGGAVTPEERAATLANVERQKLSTAAIG